MEAWLSDNAAMLRCLAANSKLNTDCLCTDPSSLGLPAKLTDVTSAFIEHALRDCGLLPACFSVASILMDPILDGILSDTGRVTITYAFSKEACFEKLPSPPKSVIVKMQSQNEAARGMAIAHDCYAMEARFYKYISTTLVPGCVARCYHIAADSEMGNYVFVFEDLRLRTGTASGKHDYGLTAVNQLQGCSQTQSESVAKALGHLHAQYWGESFPDWMPCTSDFQARDVKALVDDCGDQFLSSVYCENISLQERAAIERAMSRSGSVLRVLREGPKTMIHHDARADNLFWGDAEAPGGIVFIDWQLFAKGIGPLDLAWFVCGSVSEDLSSGQNETNSEHVQIHRHLFDIYWKTLVNNGGDRVDATSYSFEAGWRDYMIGVLWCFLYILFVVKHDNPNEVLHMFVRRHLKAMIELGADSVPLERLG